MSEIYSKVRGITENRQRCHGLTMGHLPEEPPVPLVRLFRVNRRFRFDTQVCITYINTVLLCYKLVFKVSFLLH